MTKDNRVLCMAAAWLVVSLTGVAMVPKAFAGETREGVEAVAVKCVTDVAVSLAKGNNETGEALGRVGVSKCADHWTRLELAYKGAALMAAYNPSMSTPNRSPRDQVEKLQADAISAAVVAVIEARAT